MADLERAIAFAAEAHSDQVDKQGEPYIRHVLRVMEAVSDPARRVAVLHDVCEDTDLSLPEIAMPLGLTDIERVALAFLTRQPEVSYSTYIECIADARDPRWGALAREVKVADLQDNLARWTPEVGEDLKRRYERALARLDPAGAAEPPGPSTPVRTATEGAL